MGYNPRREAGLWVAIPGTEQAYGLQSPLRNQTMVSNPRYLGFWVAIPSLAAGFWVAIPAYAASFWVAISSLVAGFWVPIPGCTTSSAQVCHSRIHAHACARAQAYGL